MVTARSIEVNSLVIAAIERIKVQALAEETSCYLVQLVFERSTRTSFQVFSLLQCFPKFLCLGVIWVNLKSLADVLFCKVVLTIVEKHSAAPE